MRPLSSETPLATRAERGAGPRYHTEELMHDHNTNAVHAAPAELPPAAPAARPRARIRRPPLMPPHVSHPRPPRTIDGRRPTSEEIRIHGFVELGFCQNAHRPAPWSLIVSRIVHRMPGIPAAAVVLELQTHFRPLYDCIVAAHGPFDPTHRRAPAPTTTTTTTNRNPPDEPHGDSAEYQ